MAIANRHASPFDPSPSPQPPPTLTKRDVRRNRIMERLQGMIDAFQSNQHQHYRAQLQALQVDMTLVLRADPYSEGPLEDGGEDIRGLVEGVIVGQQGVGDEAAQKDFLALAGKRYKEFVREANAAMEQRDAELVALHNNYQSSVAELERLTQQKLHQAEEEHKALTSTIRQRLIATITKKRQHLLRDKESLDIADSNALLLHPNQFSINNPGSPGGVGQNRKTRHLRHRAGSPSGGDAGENGVRKKRKLLPVEDESNESPAPGFRSLPPPDALGGGRSPFKDARDKNTYTQFEAPAYSLERIFTDKELAMATATAQQATYRYFHQLQQPAHDQTMNNNGTAAPVVNGENVVDPAAAQDGEEAAARPTTEAAVGTPPPTAAPEMERSASHQVLTRGGARANPLAALSDLAAAAASVGAGAGPSAVRENPFAPVVPTYHAVSRSEKSGAPAPPGVGALELESDFEMMRRAADPDPDVPAEADNTRMDVDNDEHQPQQQSSAKDMRRQLLDQALENKVVSQPYRLPLLETGPAVIGKGIERPLGTGFAPIATYEQQRAKLVAITGAGAAVGGSMAAALQGRIAGGAGGEAMSRTTSAAGSEGGEVGAVLGGGGSGRRGRRGLV